MFLAALFFFVAGFGLLLSDFLRRLEFSYSWAVAGAVSIVLSLVFLIAGMMQNKRLHEESRDSLP
jgi:hypothetical protein